MKRCLILLIVFCGLHHGVNGQSPSAAIDKLIKYRVITAKNRPVIEKELHARHRASYRVAILWGLENIMLQKTFHVDPHKTGISVSYNVSLNKKSRDSMAASLTPLLQHIKAAGLLTDRVYNYAKDRIDSGQYIVPLQMVGSLAEMSGRLESLAPKYLLPVADELHKNGIVNDSAFAQMQKDIRDRKIEYESQLSNYCSLSRTFDLAKYPDDPAVWLEQLHRDIAAMLPGLNFTNFSYTTILDTALAMGGVPGIKFKVSLKCNGRIYKYTSFTFWRKDTVTKVRAKDDFIPIFYRIFNKILTDQQSPLRLHNIMFTRPANRHCFTLIALQAQQAEVLWRNPCMSYMLVGMEGFDNTLTSARVDSTIMQWREVGLFSHLTQAQIDKSIDSVAADNLFSINNLLTKFPGVVYPLDSAFMAPQDPYGHLLNHLAALTHGAFAPGNITQRKVKGGTQLRYQANGQLHSYLFKSNYGWSDARFPAFMKGLGRANNLPGDFYQLDGENAIIYLTKAQHSYALKHNLLEFWADNRRKR